MEGSSPVRRHVALSSYLPRVHRFQLSRHLHACKLLNAYTNEDRERERERERKKRKEDRTGSNRVTRVLSGLAVIVPFALLLQLKSTRVLRAVE